MSPDDLLDLGGIDVETTGNDHVLLAIDDIDEAIFVFHADIAGAVPAVGGRDLIRGVLVLVVPRHHQGPADDNLTPLPGGRMFSSSSMISTGVSRQG